MTWICAGNLITQSCLGCCWSVHRTKAFSASYTTPTANRWDCLRTWEWKQPGQLIPTDQKAMPHHLASWSGIYKGEGLPQGCCSETGWACQLVVSNCFHFHCLSFLGFICLFLLLFKLKLKLFLLLLLLQLFSCSNLNPWVSCIYPSNSSLPLLLWGSASKQLCGAWLLPGVQPTQRVRVIFSDEEGGD